MRMHSRASIRYARALFRAAEATEAIERVKGDAQAMRELIAQTPQLQAFLEDPTIAMRDKRAILERLFREKVSPLMWRFLQTLVEHYRERLLPEILDATLALIEQREGRIRAEVTSAISLEADQIARLKRQLEQLTRKEVILNVREDPSLVAGFVVRVGDTVYDASLDAQLRRLRQQLTEADLMPAAGGRLSER